MTLIDHLEQHLGRIVGGATKDADGHRVPVTVAFFEKGPRKETRTLATVGLSKTPLLVDENGAWVREELLMVFREKDGERNMPAVLQQVALEALAARRGLLPGQVLGPRGLVVLGTEMTALYVSVPMCFRKSFHIYRPEQGESVLMAWLVPITTAEAEFCKREGPDEFEHQLEFKDPDLLDLGRRSMF